jgi:hypothetical protein
MPTIKKVINGFKTTNKFTLRKIQLINIIKCNFLTKVKQIKLDFNYWIKKLRNLIKKVNRSIRLKLRKCIIVRWYSLKYVINEKFVIIKPIKSIKCTFLKKI